MKKINVHKSQMRFGTRHFAKKLAVCRSQRIHNSIHYHINNAIYGLFHSLHLSKCSK